MNSWSDFRVLVVEDSRSQRDYVCNQLHSLGFVNIDEAENGIQAMDLLSRTKAVDFLITDLDMPGMDGIELIQQVEDNNLAAHLIVMTARDPKLLDAVENMVRENRASHLLGTLKKPLELLSLEQLLRRALQQKETLSNSATNTEKYDFTIDEIAKAILDEAFVPYFQPKVVLDSGMTKGCEALARWVHPEIGVLSPALFIPKIEAEPELIEPFTMSLLEQTLGKIAEWIRHGLHLSISFNLSAFSLKDASLADRIAEMVARHRIPPQLLVLEVTETMVMDNLSVALANLTRLRLKGFGLSMDDYGVGYSSIQQLSRCPFTELKIDRAFVHGAAENENRRVILESSIDMGRRLGIMTVGEGVETQEDWQLLRKLGCNLGQGFYAARPMPSELLPSWIRDNRERLRL